MIAHTHVIMYMIPQFFESFFRKARRMDRIKIINISINQKRNQNHDALSLQPLSTMFPQHVTAAPIPVINRTKIIFRKICIELKVKNYIFFYHPPSVYDHRYRYDLICRKSEPEVTIGLYKAYEKSIDEVCDNKKIKPILYPPFSIV